ncbi:MAG TPA: FAD-dependent oxidoreductase [Balneolales bacterium]|nr:FAD-dependent oxidoreductase [Balneolales bacterium]
MKTFVAVSLITVLITLSYSPLKAQDHQTYDVVVYGGTSAGVMAAVAAERMGASVILISPKKRIGGLTSNGLSWTDIGDQIYHRTIGGYTLNFFHRVYQYYLNKKVWNQESRADYLKKIENTDHRILEKDKLMWTFEPHVALRIFNNLIRENHIPVRLNRKLDRKNGVRKVDGRIVSITMLNGETYSGKVFIDATYEGDLMAAAGVSFTVGREGNSEYHETIDGVQLSHHHQFPNGVNPYHIAGDPSSGLLWGISPDTLLPEGHGDKRVQAYNFRICLTDSKKNQVPITRPKNYNPSRYDLLVRLIHAQPDKRSLSDYFIWSPLPNRKTDINNNGGFSTDMIGMSDDWPTGSYEKRRQLFKAHLAYTKGLLYFMGHNTRVPDTLRQQMRRWGYAKDEYQHSDHFTPELYVREGRRMIGEYVITEHNCRGTVTVNDGIAMGYYNMDSHNCERIVVNGMVKNEGNVEARIPHPYPIPYGAIVPKKKDCTNLLVPVCLSATHIAYGSIRMEPVFMELGQSSGTAAALAEKNDVDVQNLDYQKLKKQLLKTGQILN